MKHLKINNMLLMIIIILNIISLLNIFNAKLISSNYNNAFLKQIIWFTIGYLLMIIILKLRINKLFKVPKYLYIFGNILLLLVLLFGSNINGAKCWFNIFGFSFQPSELMKIFLPLYLTDIIFKNKNKEKYTLLIKMIIIVLIPSILVFLEPDTGAIINYCIIFIISISYTKFNKSIYIFLISISSLFILLFLIMFFNYQDILIKIIGPSIFYRIDRIINFANGNSYQLENALITIGSSPFIRNGINNILLYIPEAPTDFFFSFAIGNYGIISGLLIIISYFILDILLIIKNNNIKNTYYKVFISSYIGILIFHEIYNIGMNIGLLPIMGIPLPFLSYGGTSTIINYICISIIINYK